MKEPHNLGDKCRRKKCTAWPSVDERTTQLGQQCRWKKCTGWLKSVDERTTQLEWWKKFTACPTSVDIFKKNNKTWPTSVEKRSV